MRPPSKNHSVAQKAPLTHNFFVRGPFSYLGSGRRPIKKVQGCPSPPLPLMKMARPLQKTAMHE